MIWWWQFGCKRGWTKSTTILAWSIKIRSIQEDEIENKCVSADISCCRSWYVFIELILLPFIVDVLSFYHVGDLALKPPYVIISEGLKLNKKCSVWSFVWLGDL